MLSQCSKCGLSKSSGAMGSVLPQCRCDWKMPTPQRTWVGLTPTDMQKLSAEWWTPNENEMVLINWIEAKLKEKNT